MRKSVKRLISIFVSIVMLLSVSAPVFAKKDNNPPKNPPKKEFKDVKKDHWAYEDIMWMLERNIIDGVGKDRFEPNGIVTRAQFAKMMVNTLNLQLYKPQTPSFLDVKKNSWAYPYVESAKVYLTGFRTDKGDYYKPDFPAVREDMAVALVKALGYNNEAVDESILSIFTDANQISPNLRKYVALSVKYGLIQGYTENGKTVFKPNGNLTRAQAAKLLHNAFKVKEEKVTYDEDKVTYDDNTNNNNTYEKPVITLTKENNTHVLRWNKISSDKFVEYRVVISKYDDTPEYPANGYLYSITDRNRTYVVINNTDKYNGGDFGNYLKKGERYYVSVTAVYKDKTVTGNTISFTYEGQENPELFVMPIVNSSVENGKLVLRWNKINSPELAGYRVVASKSDSSPSYPENGYLYWITDPNVNYAIIDNSVAYTDGDFGRYFIKGEKYYFSITAVYKDRTVTGNAVLCQYDGADSTELFPAPAVKAAYEDGKLVVRWDKINSSLLTEYRVVISQNDETPVYPENGYFDKAYDKDTTSAVIDGTKVYSNGDFTKLTYGNEYYISVTAVYGNKYVAGNTVKILYLIEE